MEDKKKTETKYLKLSLTPEEYETLAKLSELQGRPMATLLLEFIREANVFTVLGKVAKATEKIQNFKAMFRKKTSDISASIT